MPISGDCPCFQASKLKRGFKNKQTKKNPTIYIQEKNVLQQKAMHKNRVPEPVHATMNMQVRIINKLKSRSGIPWKVYLKGNTLIDDSCCDVGK